MSEKHAADLLNFWEENWIERQEYMREPLWWRLLNWPEKISLHGPDGIPIGWIYPKRHCAPSTETAA